MKTVRHRYGAATVGQFFHFIILLEGQLRQLLCSIKFAYQVDKGIF